MIKYVVIHESGMGSSCVVSLMYNTEEEAEQEMDRLIEAGRGGAQDYTMPDGEKYWDSVGYDYLTVRELDPVHPETEWDELWNSLNVKYLTLEKIAENKKEDYKELVTTATAACFALAQIIGHEALKGPEYKEYSGVTHGYGYFKTIGSVTAIVAEFDKLIEPIELDEYQQKIVEDFHSRCS